MRQKRSKILHIPGVIDDYNHWMLGVDESDQLIAYYRPELRCRRIWMPIMLHCLDIIRINAYIIHSFIGYNKGMSQKQFLIEFVNAMMKRVMAESVATTRR